MEEFKRGGNRTRAARLLGLQRTDRARLIRDLGVGSPSAVPRIEAAQGSLPAASE